MIVLPVPGLLNRLDCCPDERPEGIVKLDRNAILACTIERALEELG